jgi:hypothetical protein
MIYKKPIELRDLFVSAYVISITKRLAKVNGHDLPEQFWARFWLKDKGRSWQTHFQIQIENEIPQVLSLRTYGAGGTPLDFMKDWENSKRDKSTTWTLKKYEQDDRMALPIQARHLTLLARFHYELTQKAVALAIESEETEKGKSYTFLEIEKLEKELTKTVGRNVPTDSMLRDVAKRYKKAEKSREPLYEDIMRTYSISERRARELITMCRRHKEKLLPKKKAGRPSVIGTTTRKKGS